MSDPELNSIERLIQMARMAIAEARCCLRRLEEGEVRDELQASLDEVIRDAYATLPKPADSTQEKQ